MTGRDPFDFSDRARGATSETGPAAAPVSPPPSVGPPRDGSFDRLPRQAAGPPLVWLLAALGAAALATLGALILGSAITVAFLCWVLAGPAAIGLIAVFVLRDTHARSLPLYIRPPWLGPLYALVVLVVVAGIGTSAWRIADWWGRL